jgi:histidyl-tRNA synthetase
MAAASTNPARGMRDFLPVDVRRREYVIGIIKEVYESYGFEPLETPAVENIETLMGKYGEEGNQLIFKILKRGEKLDASDKDLADLALRYDLTVPLARVVANHKNDLPKFFKRYQIQPVWRADRPARGRFREFYQCDVDAIGSGSMVVEAELISAVTDILNKLGFERFMVVLNHRKVLSSMLNAVGIEKSEHINALTALDKLDKIGKDGVKKEFVERGLSQESCSQLLDLFSRIDDYAVNVFDLGSDSSKYWTKDEFNKWNSFTISQLEHLIGNDNEGLEALEEVINILKLSDSVSAGERLVLSPSLARGLSYYTGAIMEINVPDLAGSLGGGGRYDGLIGMFGKEQIPACGFSLGLERIIVVMTERGMFPEDLQNASADVMVTIMDENSIGESLKLAGELRTQRLRVLVYPEADKLGKQFKYASQIGVPFVCVLGETELAENKVTLKNMQSGAQETLLREDIAKKISAQA